MADPSLAPASLQTQTEAVTETVLTGGRDATTTVTVVADSDMDDGYFDAILGAVIITIILVLIGLTVVVVRYMFRHKGSYRTNEAKGMEFAETADTALRGDPALRDAVDDSKKEYFI